MCRGEDNDICFASGVYLYFGYYTRTDAHAGIVKFDLCSEITGKRISYGADKIDFSCIGHCVGSSYGNGYFKATQVGYYDDGDGHGYNFAFVG